MEVYKKTGRSVEVEVEVEAVVVCCVSQCDREYIHKKRSVCIYSKSKSQIAGWIPHAHDILHDIQNNKYI